MGGIPLPAVAQPFDYRKNAGHDAKHDETNHGPFEIAGFNHAHDAVAESDGEIAEDQETAGTAGGNQQKQFAAGIAQHNVGGDHGHKRERRWREAGDHHREATPLADFFLKLFEAIAPSDLLDAFGSELAGGQVQQKHARRRTANRAQYVEQIALMIVGDQTDYQQIIPEWKDQKRRVHQAQNERAEVVEADEEIKERLEERRQGMIVFARPCGAPSLVRCRRTTNVAVIRCMS